MSNGNATSYSGGIGFGGLLAILFIALKLTHVIAWSWWWVLCPLWLPITVILVILAVIGAIALFALAIAKLLPG